MFPALLLGQFLVPLGLSSGLAVPQGERQVMALQNLRHSGFAAGWLQKEARACVMPLNWSAIRRVGGLTRGL